MKRHSLLFCTIIQIYRYLYRQCIVHSIYFLSDDLLLLKLGYNADYIYLRISMTFDITR